MRPIWLALVLIASLVLTPEAPRAQVHISSEERFFRIEWQLERGGDREAAILGSLTNHYLYPLQRVQLRVQVLDEAGQISYETFETMNDIPPGARGDFRLQLPVTGARFVVTVYAFEFGPRESP